MRYPPIPPLPPPPHLPSRPLHTVTDAREDLEDAEALNLRIIDIVAAAGSSFAFSSQTAYVEQGIGLDPERARAAEARVQE